MKKGKIYKIISIEGAEFYVRSTLNTARDRCKSNKLNFNNFNNGRADLFCSCFELFEKYGLYRCKMILISEYNVCDDKTLKAYETLWTNNLQGSLNKMTAFNLVVRCHHFQSNLSLKIIKNCYKCNPEA